MDVSSFKGLDVPIYKVTFSGAVEQFLPDAISDNTSYLQSCQELNQLSP